MRTFHLSAVVGVSARTVVQAETAEEAITIAKSRTVEMGGERMGNDPAEVWVIEEADGEADNICVDTISA